MTDRSLTEQPRPSRTRALADPFARLEEEMERLWQAWGVPRLGLGSGVEEGRLLPTLDLSETEDAIEVKLDVPGLTEKDVEASVTGDLLTLKGHRSHEREEKGRTWHRTERGYGAFQRTVRLPCEVDESGLEARLRNGVLTVRLAKSDRARNEARTIPIKSA
ncbi:MAG: Hsp20/alpha crystallin family protein [Alphaproteobacteria bacterium]|nr:Hsp20/alpha crystallin family protein [Alphaproteobacteria bacterium]